MVEKVVVILVPIFLIVILGYVSGKMRLLGDNGATILGRFVTHIALPALLFSALATERFENIVDLAFIAAFGLSALICFLVPLVFRFGPHEALDFRAMRGLGASFGSVSFIGVPLLTPLVGSVALPAVGVANMIVLMLMALTIVFAEIDRNGASSGLPAAIGTALRHTLTNPLVLSVVAGVCVSLSGIGLTDWIHETAQLVGAAAPSVALFALGAALVKAKLSHFGEIAALSAIKLIGAPLIALAILMLFPQVDPKWAVAAVALAALATATVAFLVAEQFDIYAEQSAALVLLTTAASAVTLPVFLLWALHLWPLS